MRDGRVMNAERKGTNAGRKGDKYRTQIQDGRGNEYRTEWGINTEPRGKNTGRKGNKYWTEEQQMTEGE